MIPELVTTAVVLVLATPGVVVVVTTTVVAVVLVVVEASTTRVVVASPGVRDLVAISWVRMATVPVLGATSAVATPVVVMATLLALVITPVVVRITQKTLFYARRDNGNNTDGALVVLVKHHRWKRTQHWCLRLH